jgi:integrase
VLQRTRQALADDYARATVELTFGRALTIMRAAYAAGRISRDPTRGLRPPRRRADEPDDRIGPDDVPTRAEALALLGATPARFRAATAFGLAGLRIGEVLGLSADRIDIDRRLVRIDRQLQRIDGQRTLVTPKAEKVRTIELPGALAVEVRRHLRDHQGAGLLFRGARCLDDMGMRPDQFYVSAWKPALAGAGLPHRRFTFHSLRHWCASSMLAGGAPLTAVAGHLGDEVATVARTYAHWLRDDRHIPAEVLDRLLGPVADEEGAGDERN